MFFTLNGHDVVISENTYVNISVSLLDSIKVRFDPSANALHDKTSICAALNKAAEWAKLAERESPASFVKDIAKFPSEKLKLENGQPHTYIFRFVWDQEDRKAGVRIGHFDDNSPESFGYTAYMPSNSIPTLITIIDELPAMNADLRAKVSARDDSDKKNQNKINELFH